ALTAVVAFWTIMLSFVLASLYASELNSYGTPVVPTWVALAGIVNLSLVYAAGWLRKLRTSPVDRDDPAA
ncbi:MAG: hypothetical protein MI861_24615, partial [Pirellulales bacterium]|nr:hypothetical protein [Pirellulales bacterium]